MDGGSSTGNTRSGIEKERTKMRERQRRSITTKIFHGLRKHGGYPLSPRSDINEVLRHLAFEAGWIVEPDGTTYRSTAIPNGSNVCSVCEGGRGSGTPTPTSSIIAGGLGRGSGTPTPTSSIIIGGGGECSTTTSPRRVTVGDSAMGFGGPSSLYYHGGLSSSHESDIPVSTYTYGRLAGEIHHSSAATGGGGPPSVVKLGYHHPQQVYLAEARASNHNTPVGSPRRRS